MLRSTLRATVVMAVLGVVHDANADCVISGPRPTVPLPTTGTGQAFSFIASDECETLTFHVHGTALTKIPKGGPATGRLARTYKVVLTPREWDGVVAQSVSTVTWSITGKTSTGSTTRVTTTNELEGDDAVSLDLSNADAKLVGETQDFAGYSVSGVGDVDGDGRADVLVGAPFSGEGGWQSGAAYLVLGPPTGTVALSSADATLVGIEGDRVGMDVSGAGDIDGDGHDDLLIGAPWHTWAETWGPGAAYVVMGPVTGTFDLSLADATLSGRRAVDDAGVSVSRAGDVDGDGHDDVLLGADGNDQGGLGAGAAYLVLGPLTGDRALGRADAVFVGEAPHDGAGIDVSGVGDTDADGHDDVLVGASGDDEGGLNAGAAYLVLGPVTGTFSLSRADAKLMGEGGNNYAGLSVSGAGDVDGDGHDDLLVGAYDNSAGGHAGAAYLVLGPVTGTLDLSSADAKLVGEAPFDGAGITVAGAGDVDADDHDDVLVGAYSNDAGGSDAGAAYLVLGPVRGTLDLADADLVLVGEDAGDGGGGVALSAAGDLDGDGRDDVLVGMPSHSDGGAAYLIYGSDL